MINKQFSLPYKYMLL